MTMNSIWAALFVVILTAFPAFSQIKPGQAIQISILGVKAEEQQRINAVYPVSDAGMVNMPYVGQVKAAGFRPEALQLELEAIYKRQGIYSQPTFQVIASNIQVIDQQVVHIGGQVRKTGQVKFAQGLTVYQAVQAAGGPTEFGSMHRVRLFRDGKLLEIDLTKAENIQVKTEEGDTIEVPRKNWRNR